MNPFPVTQAGQLDTQGPQTQWLIEGLWTDQAVGILGGEPKCCKSFLALDLAVSVASGQAALRHFPVRRSGRVLLFPAEDSLAVVRQRLAGICAAAGVDLESLAIDVITAPALRLDLPADRARLRDTIAAHRPILLILDPLIRLHRLEENDATQIAALLSWLRELQREYQVAVLVVHHARKDSGGSRPGQALRGSSELHGWGDSNLYLRRRGPQLTLSTEHRAASSQDHLPVSLQQSGAALALALTHAPVHAAATTSSVSTPPGNAETSATLQPVERVRRALSGLQEPIGVQRLRQLCGMRTSAVCAALAELSEQGLVSHDDHGYQLKLPLEDPVVSLPIPIGPAGNGNGKRAR